MQKKERTRISLQVISLNQTHPLVIGLEEYPSHMRIEKPAGCGVSIDYFESIRDQSTCSSDIRVVDGVICVTLKDWGQAEVIQISRPYSHGAGDASNTYNQLDGLHPQNSEVSHTPPLCIAYF